jgi:hypothetical protein
MTPRPKAAYPKDTVLTLRVSEGMYRDLQDVFERDGVAISEQVRRGIRLWLESKGVVKTERGARGKRGQRS